MDLDSARAESLVDGDGENGQTRTTRVLEWGGTEVGKTWVSGENYDVA